MARKNVSNRVFLKADGTKSVGPDPAGSVKYQLLEGDGQTVHKEWEWRGDHFSQFGFVTKVGNVANSVLNADEPGTAADAAEEIDTFLAGIAAGVWREPGTGAARGPKYDTAILAHVLHAMLGNTAKGDSDHYRGRLEADKSYRLKVVARDDIKAAYWAEVTARGGTKPDSKPTDSLA